ncbi:hypothetical protein, partial [Brevibacillus agri]|uniref:hypothetical protein n=1 Tax=Brevibacillus agri TaxID=51101 RepID=UPI001C8D8286
MGANRAIRGNNSARNWNNNNATNRNNNIGWRPALLLWIGTFTDLPTRPLSVQGSLNPSPE